MSFEKVVTIVGGIVGILVVVATVVTAYDHLNSRLDKVDDKIGAIQKTLGSTPCTAILNRELAAIDKGREDIRKELERLSNHYGCAPSNVTSVGPDLGAENAVDTSRIAPDTAKLDSQLNAVDEQLGKKN